MVRGSLVNQAKSNGNSRVTIPLRNTNRAPLKYSFILDDINCENNVLPTNIQDGFQLIDVRCLKNELEQGKAVISAYTDKFNSYEYYNQLDLKCITDGIKNIDPVTSDISTEQTTFTIYSAPFMTKSFDEKNEFHYIYGINIFESPAEGRYLQNLDTNQMAYLLHEKGCPHLNNQSSLSTIPTELIVGCVLGGLGLTACLWKIFKSTRFYHYMCPPPQVRFSNLTGYESPHYSELN